MHVSRMITLIAPLAVALTMTARPVHAHGRGGPCRQDIQQFCPDITPGPGSFTSIQDCLQQSAGNLSPACQQQLTEMHAKVSALLQTCGSDIQVLCSTVASDTHATLKCLHQNRSSLSPACQDQLPSHHGRHHHGKACSPPADSGSENQ